MCSALAEAELGPSATCARAFIVFQFLLQQLLRGQQIPSLLGPDRSVTLLWQQQRRRQSFSNFGVSVNMLMDRSHGYWIHTHNSNKLFTYTTKGICLPALVPMWMNTKVEYISVCLLGEFGRVCLFVSKLMVYPWTPSKQNLIIIVQWTNKQTTNKRSEFPYTHTRFPAVPKWNAQEWSYRFRSISSG